MKGAPIPEGFDSVVMIEYTKFIENNENGEEVIEILSPFKKGDNIREIGSDIQQGELLFKKGDVVGPSEIGLLASVGVIEVSVYQSPVVSVLSTGLLI